MLSCLALINNKNQMSRQMEECLMQLFEAFSEGDSVDLRKVKQHFKEDRNAQQTCSIFLAQLEAVPHNYMNRNQFVEYFSPPTSQANYISSVFDAIDTSHSGRITKAQVKEFFGKHGTTLSEAELGAMMDGHSGDGSITLYDLQSIMKSR